MTVMEKQKVELERLRGEYTETERIILQRRSVRKYKNKQVPEWMVKRILEAGRYAPSAGNCQPWKFVVVREPRLIEGMTEDVVAVAKKMHRMIDYREPGRGWLWPLTKLLIRFNINTMNPAPFGALKYLAEKRLDLYYKAPTVILIFKDKRGISNPDLDCGIVGQNMALAAHSLGLGSCWVSFTSLLFKDSAYAKKWNAAYGIDYPYEFGSSLAIGWPFGQPNNMVKRPIHPVDWFEGGGKKTLSAQGSCETIDKRERRLVPRFDDRRQIIPGIVHFDNDKCSRCGLCLTVCPSKALTKVDDTLQMLEEKANECVYCGACQAICPNGAIEMDRANSNSGMFKTLGQGTPSFPRLDDGWL